MSGADAKRSASYSTGGGGVVLEHKYGATLIATLLTGDPLPELGDYANPVQVRFQASAESPVDDFLITGRTPDGKGRRVSVGVRRAPQLVASEAKTVALFAGYVREVTDHWDEMWAGRRRLALATGSRDKSTVELRDLVDVARHQSSGPAFRAEVARGGRVGNEVRGRLIQIDKLLRAAAAQARIDAASFDVQELTWRLLSSLTVRELRLEGTDTTDRAHTVGQLRRLTREQTNEAADDLFNRLAYLAGSYAPAGAIVTEQSLRRDLSGVPLAGTGRAQRRRAAAPASEAQPRLTPVFVTSTGTTPAAEVPLTARWRASEEGWLSDRRYLLLDEKAGLLREERDPAGEHTRRQALARQTDPVPAAGQAYAWLRQGGRYLTRERDLLARAQAASGASGLPRIAYYDAGAGAVTLAISWPVEKDGLPCETLGTRFPPGTLDAWRISLLLAGFRGVMLLLERLHRLGAAHRNLTPESIVVDATGQFTLRDLGLAAVSFRPGEGPASYQAPEQAFGARMPRPGPATDVYQLAAIAYHVITGRVPGRGASPVRHPALPEPVTDVISTALAASPADRPGARELRAALQAPNPRPKQSSQHK